MKSDHPPAKSLLLVLGVTGLLCSGCQTYTEQNTALTPWRGGNYSVAAAEYGKMAEKAKGKRDSIIWRLEHAASLRAAGRCQESNAAFDQAEREINRYEEGAKVKVARETAALLSNQANLPYEGRAYDKVMLNTYKALNYLQLGQYDSARVELIRTYQRQRDAVELNRRRIERENEELRTQKDRDRELASQARQDQAVNASLDAKYGNLRSLKVYGDYVNPFSVYLDALFFMFQAADSSDLERAAKSLERVEGFVEDQRFVRQDRELLSQIMASKPLPPTTYVIFESGLAPVREQFRMDIPLILSRVYYLGAAFPVLDFQYNPVSSLKVTAGGVTETTVLLCSMDSVIGREFQNELPGIIAKTIVATVAKGAAAYAIQDAAYREDKAYGVLASILTSVYQFAVNIADCRTWTTLPKEFQFCRFPTPPDRRVIVSAAGGQRQEVVLEPATVNLLNVKAVNSGVPLVVSQTRLK